MPTAQISEIRFFIGCRPAVPHHCIGTAMSQLVPFLAPITMTSREIAELTGKRHDNVLRDIDNLVENLPSELRYGFQSGTYVSGDPPREYRQFILDRDSAYCLIAGYEPNSRMRIIKRWQELEAQAALPQPQVLSLPSDPRLQAPLLFKADLEVSALLGIPLHLAQVEAARVVRDETGIDYLPRLALAPAQSQVKEEDVMLEPTELAELLQIESAAAVNRWLANLGLQSREGKEWVPTEQGKPYCARHHWSSKNKSGYNLKWSLAFVLSCLPGDWPN